MHIFVMLYKKVLVSFPDKTLKLSISLSKEEAKLEGSKVWVEEEGGGRGREV